MKQTFKINIPNPCFENWDEMTPQKNGKHCASCNKIVVDFTKMTDVEVKGFFVNNQSAKTCGHFYKHQISDNRNRFKNTLISAYTNAQNINLKLFRYTSLCLLSVVFFLCGCTQPTTGKVECEKPEKLTGDSITTPIIDSNKIKKDTLKQIFLGVPIIDKQENK